MKNILLIPVMLFPVYTCAQPKWSIGISGSTDYCYRTLTADNAQVKKDLDNHETFKFGYSAGAQLRRHFSNRFAFGTGILFTNTGYSTEPMDLHPADPSDPLVPLRVTTYTHVRSVQVPARFELSLGGKLRFNGFLGLNANFLINETYVMYLDFRDREETMKSTSRSGYNDIYYSASAGAGAEIDLNKFSFRAMPVFTHVITPMYKTSSSNQRYLWTAGLELSAFMKF